MTFKLLPSRAALRSAFDLKSLFVRIALVIMALSTVCAGILSYAYYYDMTARGLNSANDLKTELVMMFAETVSLDTTRNVTRRIDIKLEDLQERLDGVVTYSAVVKKDGTILSELGTSAVVGDINFEGIYAELSESLEPMFISEPPLIVAPSILPNGKLAGFAVVSWDETQILNELRGLALMAAGLLAACFLVWAIIVIATVRRLVGRPLKTVSQVLEQFKCETYDISDHDFGKTREMQRVRVGFDALSESLEHGKTLEQQRLIENEAKTNAINSLSTALEKLANQDLSTGLHTEFAGQYDALRQNFNVTQQAMAQTLHAITEVCAAFDLEIKNIVDASASMSIRSEDQAKTLSTIVSAISDANAGTQVAVERARQVEKTVVNINGTVTKGGEVVTAAVGAMGVIESGSSEIQKIISVIEDISFQTSLLALNASVEASRAGDAGRGFAVVANEVLSLSARTGAAAEEIRNLILDSVEQVGQGVALVQDVGDILDNLIEGFGTINTGVNGLVSNFESFSDTLEQLQSGAAQLDQATHQSAIMVDEMKQSTDKLNDRSMELQDQVGQFLLPRAMGQATSIEHAA